MLDFQVLFEFFLDVIRLIYFYFRL